MKEARNWERLDETTVRCHLCRHECTIEDGKTGFCAVRRNEQGTLYSLVYDKIVSANVDPIEKKPLFHVAPGSKSFSIATVGCNFRCSFCQNASISQMPRDRGQIVGDAVPPEKIAAMAAESGCKTIAYTYTEPTIYYEIARDTMEEAKKRDIANVFVTNGYMSRTMLDDCRGLLDAANVDLKGFNDTIYTKYCKIGKPGREGVMDTLRYMKELGIWVEITTLLIPTLNDDMSELKELVRFIISDLGPETPWHVSRFFPQYKERALPPTDIQALQDVWKMGTDEGLYYVYIGNVPWTQGEQTLCPDCSTVLVNRSRYTIGENIVRNGMCPQCSRPADGIMM
jgi:pyruvate formate lyase activating enzyme